MPDLADATRYDRDDFGQVFNHIVVIGADGIIAEAKCTRGRFGVRSKHGQVSQRVTDLTITSIREAQGLADALLDAALEVGEEQEP